jgi:hypothetical protein
MTRAHPRAYCCRNGNATSCNVATLASGATVGGGQFCFNHHGVHTEKVGLNYRFGPVVAS